MRAKWGKFNRNCCTLAGAALCAALSGPSAVAGPFVDPGILARIDDPDQPGTQIANPELRTWAAAVVDYQPAPGLITANRNPANALGPVGTTTGGRTVSLGDLDADQIAAGVLPGSITLALATPVANGPGWDLAVFENGFSFFPPDQDKLFAELGYVDVSSDGVHFARLPSVSLTTSLFAPFGASFGGIDPTDVKNLGGRHPSLIGTGLDLADLVGLPAVQSGDVDIEAIRFVRIVDIPGDGSRLDSLGHPILDAWPTTDLTFGDGGMDLDAVAGRYPVPEPAAVMLAATGTLGWLGLVRRRRAGKRFGRGE